MARLRRVDVASKTRIRIPLLSLLSSLVAIQLPQSSSLLLVRDCCCRAFSSLFFLLHATDYRRSKQRRNTADAHTLLHPAAYSQSFLGCFGTPCRTKIKTIRIQSLLRAHHPSIRPRLLVICAVPVSEREPAYTVYGSGEIGTFSNRLKRKIKKASVSSVAAHWV
jgi:hypothetical protein